MIHYATGDMLQAPAVALVNTVNTVGVMGKGIALQFKEAFPSNNRAYMKACKDKALQPGELFTTWDENITIGKRLIINFATKAHWRHPSKYEYIDKGLNALRILLEGHPEISSIALPPLGCGNGGLDWSRVRAMIEQYLGDVSTDVYVYQPNDHIKAILQRQESPKQAKLTPARAMLLYALFQYEDLGEYSSLFSANKLAYFLQRLGQPLKLQFVAHNYGPYAEGVKKVLYALNGTYLKGLEQQQAKAFEPLMLDYSRWQEVKDYVETQLSIEEKARLQKLSDFIYGFESELSIEILATVYWILGEHPDATFEQVITKIHQWNERKQQLFKEEYVKIAYNHIRSYEGQTLVSQG